MTECATPPLECGQTVRAVIDLFNDGSYPDLPAEELLVREGEQGEIVQVGLHVETRTFVYMVEFDNRRVVGCVDGEVQASAPAPRESCNEGSSP